MPKTERIRRSSDGEWRTERDEAKLALQREPRNVREMWALLRRIARAVGIEV